MISRGAGAEKHAVAVFGWHLVEKLPQGLLAFAFVAHFSGGDSAGAGADVRRAVLLTRVVQVAGFGGVQAVVVLRKGRLTCVGRDVGRVKGRVCLDYRLI